MEKRTNARYWIVVMVGRSGPHPSMMATALRFLLPVRNICEDIGLDPVEWAMCSLPSHGLMLSGNIRRLVAGPFWFKTRSSSGLYYLVDVYLAARLRRYL
ncbi:hypothetical protein ACLBR5_09200 [Escherichia coli]